MISGKQTLLKVWINYDGNKKMSAMWSTTYL